MTWHTDVLNESSHSMATSTRGIVEHTWREELRMMVVEGLAEEYDSETLTGTLALFQEAICSAELCERLLLQAATVNTHAEMRAKEERMLPAREGHTRKSQPVDIGDASGINDTFNTKLKRITSGGSIPKGAESAIICRFCGCRGHSTTLGIIYWNSSRSRAAAQRYCNA